jgi:hypothetical protein
MQYPTFIVGADVVYANWLSQNHPDPFHPVTSILQKMETRGFSATRKMVALR